MKMRRILLVLVLTFAMIACLCACGGGQTEEAEAAGEATEAEEVVEEQTDEAIVTELYIAWLAESENKGYEEELADYRVDSVKVLTGDEKQQLVDDSDYYLDTDIMAVVNYSVKPEDINDTAWIAGNGKIDGDWIVNKQACVVVRDGEIIAGGTGW